MDIQRNRFDDTSPRVYDAGSSSSAGNDPSPTGRVQQGQDLRGANAVSRLQAVQDPGTIGVTFEQLELWGEEARLTDREPRLKYPHQNENVAKEIRVDIVKEILQRNPSASQNVNREYITLNGIDLPNALRQVAHTIASGFYPPKDKSTGFNFKSKDKYSCSLVYCAARYGHTEAIKALGELKADVNTPDKDGETPVWIAAKFGHTEAIKALGELKADVNTPNNYGQTPVWV
ncbi:MAG: ankyrin repeat domain-containing protein, partial [Gammaproteobacteria bacterium]